MEKKINKINLLKHSIKNNKTIVWNIFSLWTLQIFSYIIPLITLPYVLRVLWPEKFWITAFAWAFVGYFIIIVNYWFNFTTTKEISIHRENNKKISEIFWNIIFIKFLLALCCFFVSSIIVFSFQIFSKEYIVFLFTFLMIIWEVFFPIWLFQWMEKMKYITIINVIIKSLFLIPIFLFIQSKEDYIFLPLITSFSFIITWIVGFIMSIKVFKLQFISPNINSIKNHLVEWWHVFISTLFISLYTTSTTFILWIFTNNTIVWYYSSAEKLIRAFQWLISPVSQAIYPNISKKMKISKNMTIVFLKKITILIWGITFFISIIILFWADFFVKLLYWEDYIWSIIILRILSLLPFIVWLSNIFWILTMLNFWYKKEFSKILIFFAITSISFSIPWVILFKEIWMASIILITEILITIVMWLFLYKKWINLLNFNLPKNEH